MNAGDHCKGYFLANANFNHDNFDAMMAGKMKSGLVDVVLVRKSYPNARKRSRNRNWKLKTMAKTEDLESRTKMEKLNAEKDYEMFLQDVEEDPELRGMMNLFKNADAVVSTDPDEEMIDSEDEPEADFPEINMDDLLDDIQEMKLEDDEVNDYSDE